MVVSFICNIKTMCISIEDMCVKEMCVPQRRLSGVSGSWFLCLFQETISQFIKDEDFLFICLCISSLHTNDGDGYDSRQS